jgi:DNA repair exonuclease SbcCD ATPase subunit
MAEEVNSLQSHVKMLEEALAKYEALAISLAQKVVDRDLQITNHLETIESHKSDLKELADRIAKSISQFADSVLPPSLDNSIQTPQPVPNADPAATNVM